MNGYESSKKVELLLRRTQFLIVYWILLSIGVIVLDYLTGPFVYFPIFFLFPIVLATWFNGLRWGFVFACCLSIVRLFFSFVWSAPWSMLETLVNTTIRLIIFSLTVLLVDREVKRRALLEEVKILRGLLPICSFCKKIRTKDDTWVPVEEYLHEHSEAEFSHGFCPDCLKVHYGVNLPSQR
jgi:glucose-6-phosphate-specific signal transduction histidine kinase